MAIKRELVQFVIVNSTDCNFDIPLFQQNVYSINATTKYSWDITSEDISCGTGSLIINAVTYNFTFTGSSLVSLLASLNALGFGFFCSETIGGNTYIYTTDDTNVYGDLTLCAVTTTTTTTTTTAAPTTTTTTTSTTTEAPTTTTTTTSTTTEAATTTTTTTSTTTETPTTTTTTTTTTEAAPATTTTTTTTTEAPTTTTTTTSTTTEAPTTTTTTTTTTEAPTTTTTTTLPLCASSVSFDVTVAGDVQIKDCCGLTVINSYAIGSYNEVICVPTDGSALTPIDAVITNVVYSLPSCDCPPTTTTTSTTTSTTTIGLTRSFSLDNSSGATCSMTNQFTLFVPVGTPSPTPSGTTLYSDPACTTPLTSTSYTYVVEIIPSGNTTGNTIYQFDNTTAIIGISVGTCP